MDSATTVIHRRRWGTLAVLCLSLLVIGIDNTILNVALPTLVEDLGATASQQQWMVDAYVLMFASLLLTSGMLADRYGRRGALQVGLKAGVGSAVNDTNRLVGGSLGVAVLGSLLSSGYHAAVNGSAAIAQLPAATASAARDSLGGAVQVARSLGGPTGQSILDEARNAFVHAMSHAVLAGAAVALAGALLALEWLPARAREGLGTGDTGRQEPDALVLGGHAAEGSSGAATVVGGGEAA